jgi:hypothetical protein
VSPAQAGWNRESIDSALAYAGTIDSSVSRLSAEARFAREA